MRLYTYIVKYDRGLAPNPYWEWCTLAVCTPNHMGARARKGDWIAGFLSKERGNRFLYAMELAEDRIRMDRYFQRTEFQSKKPNLKGNWMQRCGDNFYSLRPDGLWQQHSNRYHYGQGCLEQDTRCPFVFVAKRFWYFGRSATSVDPRFLPLIPDRQGIRHNHDPGLVRQFCEWLSTLDQGVRDFPMDNCDLNNPPTGQCDSCLGKCCV
jgi:hypothetical protein